MEKGYYRKTDSNAASNDNVAIHNKNGQGFLQNQ